MNVEIIKFKEITLELKRTYISNLTRAEYECIEIAVPFTNDTFTSEAYVKLTHPTHNDLKLNFRQFCNLFTPGKLNLKVNSWVQANREIYLILDITDDVITLELTSFDSHLIKVSIPEFVGKYIPCGQETIKFATEYNSRNTTYKRKHQRNLKSIGEK